jgi:hypothetical protein
MPGAGRLAAGVGDGGIGVSGTVVGAAVITGVAATVGVGDGSGVSSDIGSLVGVGSGLSNVVVAVTAAPVAVGSGVRVPTTIPAGLD